MGKSQKQRLLDVIASSDLSPASSKALFELVSMNAVALAPAPASTFRSKKNGYACSDPVSPCSRTDIRTPKRAAIHATTKAELAVAGHSFDHQPLPK